MKRRLTRGLAAAALAVAITLPMGAQPASASWTAVIAVVKEAYALYKDYQANRLSLADATRQIINRIDSARTEILARIDQVAAAEVRACARAATIDFVDIERMTTDTLQAFARDTTGCVTRAESLVGTVTDKAAVDTLGMALNAVAPIALTARARAGWETASLLSTAVSGNNTLVVQLEPSCRTWRVSEPAPVKPIVEEFYECTAYNGAVVQDSRMVSPNPGPPINKELVKDLATGDTSRAMAKAVLPVLQA